MEKTLGSHKKVGEKFIDLHKIALNAVGNFDSVNLYFQLILLHCNADNFQVFLNYFSKENPTEFKIIVFDNGRFHKAKIINYS